MKILLVGANLPSKKTVYNILLTRAANEVKVIDLSSCEDEQKLKLAGEAAKISDILIFTIKLPVLNSNLDLLLSLGNLSPKIFLLLTDVRRTQLSSAVEELKNALYYPNETRSDLSVKTCLELRKIFLHCQEKLQIFALPKEVRETDDSLQNFLVTLTSTDVEESKLEICRTSATFSTLSRMSRVHKQLLLELRKKLLEEYTAKMQENLPRILAENPESLVPLVKLHTELALKLEEKFSTLCKECGSYDEQNLFRGQLLVALELLKNFFNSTFSLDIFAENLQAIKKLVDKTVELQTRFSVRVEQLQKICELQQQEMKIISDLTLQQLESATKEICTTTTTKKEHAEHIRAELAKAQKDLAFNHLLSFCGTLALVVGLSFTVTGWISTFNSAGWSGLSKAVGSTVLKSVVGGTMENILVPATVKPFLPLLKLASLTASSTTAISQTSTSTIPTSSSTTLTTIPTSPTTTLTTTPTSTNILTNIRLPSVYETVDTTSTLPSLHGIGDYPFVPLSVSASTATSERCTVGGYWNAIVEGFKMAYEDGKLAFEMSLNAYDAGETAGEAAAGFYGAHVAAKVSNIYKSVKDYHSRCK